ncbi:hypothetical protein CCH79_00018229 [Gambusia affinis]|uniref:Uncharacterized protein n=1 Tax=Gambusia affinis TaxID=33528 RepID=A0A315VSJ0_GAMAF|nr:hypothetical protein CCH79_00018229 [Gambusia affinis]
MAAVGIGHYDTEKRKTFLLSATRNAELDGGNQTQGEGVANIASRPQTEACTESRCPAPAAPSLHCVEAGKRTGVYDPRRLKRGVVSEEEQGGDIDAALANRQLIRQPLIAPHISFNANAGLDTEFSINLSTPLSNVSFRVCAYTGAGPGPWSPIRILVLSSPETGKFRGLSDPATFSWHWWYVVMAVTGAVALAILLAVYVAKLRRKETRFGEAFEPMMERGQLVVRYRARRSYSRRPLEATHLTPSEEKHFIQGDWMSEKRCTSPRTMTALSTTVKDEGIRQALLT